MEKEKENQNLKELGDTQSGYVTCAFFLLFVCSLIHWLILVYVVV